MWRRSLASFPCQKRLLSSIGEKFDAAVNAVPLLKSEPSNDVKLKMYGLFSQAKKGPCNTPPPGMFDMVGKAKHNAWSSLKNMSQEEAMQEYVKIVSSLHGGTIPTATADSQNSAAVPSKSTDIPTSASPLTLASAVFPRRDDAPNNVTLKTINMSIDEAGIALITFNRPTHHNALSFQMWTDLLEVFRLVEQNKKARVAIITGSAKAFTSGMDLSVFADMQSTFNQEKCEGRQREAIIRAVKWLQDAISAPETLSIPVIAAVAGHCIGAGVDLVTACDLRYATKDASFCVKETDLGMVADVGTLQRLPKLIGDQRSRELAYTARVINGAEAERIGLVARCFDTYEELIKHVREDVAATIASKSPLTIRGIKKTILYTRDHSVEDSLKQVQYHNAAHLYSADLMEAMQAAMAKKKPTFKD